MKAHHFTTPNAAALGRFLAGVQAEGGRPTLAIVFACIDQDVQQLLSTFAAYGIEVCGCSTAGEIVGGELQVGSISGLLLELDPAAFTVCAPSTAPIGEQAAEIGQRAIARYAEPQVLLLTGGIWAEGGFMLDGEAMVRDIQAAAGRELFVVGGLAADNYRMASTHVYAAGEVSGMGLAAVIFDAEKVTLHSRATSGWEAIGIDQDITSATGNVLHSINGEPALSYFERYFGNPNAVAAGAPKISVINAQYPIQIQRHDGMVLRAPAFAHADGQSIVFAGGLRTGERFRFSTVPGFEVIEETVAHFRDYHADRPQPDAAIMISCKGRHAAFGPLLEDEVAQIYAVFGVPMAGYLSYGEIGALASGRPQLHNDTVCLITFTEVRPAPVCAR